MIDDVPLSRLAGYELVDFASVKIPCCLHYYFSLLPLLSKVHAASIDATLLYSIEYLVSYKITGHRTHRKFCPLAINRRYFFHSLCTLLSMESPVSKKRKSPDREGPARTPTGTPVRKRMRITQSQKQALVDNLQLESAFICIHLFNAFRADDCSN